MTWTFDDSRAEGTLQVPSAAMRKYYDWRRLVRDGGLDPKTAAEQVGDCDYEQYIGAPGRWTIRLSQGHRVFFKVDSSLQQVAVEKIGTHKWW